MLYANDGAHDRGSETQHGQAIDRHRTFDPLG